MDNVVAANFESGPSFEQCLKFWEGHYADTLPEGYHLRSLSSLPDGEEKSILSSYNPDSDDFGFLLIGRAGVGKTYVLNAIMNDILKAAYIHRVSLVKLISYYPVGYLIYKLRTKKDGIDYERCLNAQFLFLDDLGVENTTDFAREHFFTILDLRCQKRKPTFISTNLSLNELNQKYGERITSRLKEMCAIIEIKGSDKRSEILKDRVSILKERMKERAQ